MTDPTKKVVNAEEGNPFISLKNILGDEKFSSIAIEELAKAIEAYGIYTYDAFDRLFLCKVDSEQGQKVKSLLLEFKFHDPNYNEEHGIQEYDPSPLDDIINENFGKYPSEPQTFPSQYNYYGWLKSDLPDFPSIEPNKTKASTANQPKTSIVNQEHVKDTLPIIKNESTHDALPLNGIALMFLIDPDETKNIKKWRRFAQDSVKNGLNAYRTAVGMGKAQSKFDPAGVGEWLVSKGKMNQDKVNRILNKNLPERSAHLKDMY